LIKKLNFPIELQFSAPMYLSSSGIIDEEEHLSWLSEEEKEIWATIRTRRNRWGWLAARIAVKQGAMDWAKEQHDSKLEPYEISILHKGLGRPYIEWTLPSLPPQVSLSHKFHQGLATFSSPQTPIGCDIETMIIIPSNVLHYFTSPYERHKWNQALMNILNKEQVNTLLWSLKESVIKCVPSGFRSDFYPFQIMVISSSNLEYPSSGTFYFKIKQYSGFGAWLVQDNAFLTNCILDSIDITQGGYTLESCN